MGETRSHWVRWHEEYEDPSSRLSQRLAVVQQLIADALDAMPSGPVAVLSLCAGEGRDLLGVLERHPRAGDVRGRLVELDPDNAEVARRRVEALGVAIEVVTGDASLTDCAAGAVPADLVIACGIFGNISDADVENTIRRLPGLCRPGATVVWTRHTADPDLTPQIRAWFASAGFEEVSFVRAADLRFGVGSNRLRAEPAPFEPGVRLFSFLR